MQYQEAVNSILKIINENKGPILFLLKGKLGAGKTYLTREVVLRLIPQALVNSPTFTLLKEYGTYKNKKIVHVDLYRLKDSQDPETTIEQLGLDDYLDSSIIFVEWPDPLLERLPELAKLTSIYIIEIIHKGKNQRVYNIYKYEENAVTNRN